jgi:site-specific DNA recombinase
MLEQTNRAMKRAAIYARFSSDLQSDRSIEDQFAICQERAKRDGFKVVAKFDDRARSGASVFGRAGLAEMMDSAKTGAFDVLVVEALDRISRDQEDMASIFKRLSFQGIEILTVHEGKADAIQVGIRGIVSSLYLTDLAHKVRRGAAGNIRDGKHAGGLAYGYRTTPGKPGEWKIFEPEAQIIRRIFQEYAGGERSRAIVGRLNAEGIGPPRGTYWSPGTLTGSSNRHNGILGNEIYAGRLVWNRVRMIRDRDTGKRVSRSNPESEWHRSEVPALTIVDPELWAAVQDIRIKRSHAKPAYRRKPKHMLSGLLRCGSCGGGMSVKGEDRGGTRIVCTQFHNAKTCKNNRSYYLHYIEQTVVGGLRRHLVDPSAIKLFLQEYQAERKRLASDSINRRGSLERELSEVGRKLERAMSAMLESNAPIESFTAAIGELEARKNRIKTELANLAESVNVIALHPQAQAKYLRIVDDLAATIRDRKPGTEMANAIWELIESVTVVKTEPGEALKIDVQGRLAALLDAPVFPSGSMSGVKVVAGEGLEPPTPGL